MWVFEWTGEQFLPAIKDASDVYQHLHRYLYASELLKGKRVLDLASGDGSGSNILAQTAASVVAIVADERIAEHAGERYKKPNLRFISGNTDDQGFDAAVWFDILEPIEDHCPLLADVKRVLKQDGLFIVSVRVDEATKDITLQRLHQSLTAQFKRVDFFGQAIYAGSSIWPIESGAARILREIVMARDDADEFVAIRGELRVPSSLIAVAGDSPVTVQAGGSLFVDQRNELLKDKDKNIQELLESRAYQVKALESCNSQLAERRESLASLQQAYAWHKSQIESLSKARDYLDSEISHYRNVVDSNGQALQWRTSQVQDLEATVASTASQIQALDEALAWRASQVEQLEAGLAWRTSQVEELARAVEELNKAVAWHVSQYETLHHETDQLRIRASELNAMKASAGWKFVLRVRSMRNQIAPAGSLRHRLYKTIMRFAKSRG
jgi:ubiquinone/menaquinone biosynthesis C-methylase UbiE/uncharacterized coiled-coil protein SlyX